MQSRQRESDTFWKLRRFFSRLILLSLSPGNFLKIRAFFFLRSKWHEGADSGNQWIYPREELWISRIDPRDTLTVLRLLRIAPHLLRGKVDRSLPPWHARVHTHMHLRVHTCARFHRYKWTFARGRNCILLPSFSLLSRSFFLIFAPLSVLHPGHRVSPTRPTLRTNWWKWQETRSSQAARELQNQEFLENRATGSSHVSEPVFDRSSITCARFIKIKDRALKRHGLKCRFARCPITRKTFIRSRRHKKM